MLCNFLANNPNAPLFDTKRKCMASACFSVYNVVIYWNALRKGLQLLEPSVIMLVFILLSLLAVSLAKGAQQNYFFIHDFLILLHLF